MRGDPELGLKAMITTHRLTKVYDGKVAVESLTMEIRPGEIFGLLGPNGAGKTTTVRMLAALIAPTSGEAIIGGYRLGEHDAEIRRLVGIVTEAPGHYERLSARENLELYAKLYGVRDVSRRVEKYLRLLGLWDQRHEPVGTFSKGMKQKLALARALVHEPKILLLDEPTSGLDPQMTRIVREFIAELKKQGRTILLCTHNLDEAERLCDRILVLNARPVALDTPEALHRRLFGRRVVVTLAEVTDEIVNRVRALDFVRDIERDGRRLVLALEDPERENPFLVRALVEAGAAIQSLTEQEHSLEEIYLRLLEEERAREAARATS